MRNKRLPEISVGIPAHNEGETLPALLQSILSQHELGYSLKEIIVIADGCSDNTVEKVKLLGDKRITVIDEVERKGKSVRLNELFQKFSGDILLLMDADITLRDKNLLQRISAFKHFSDAGVVGINTLPLSSKNFFQACLNYSVIAQRDIINNWHNGQNYLSFRGACMALDKGYAKLIHIPQELVNNDAYIYFFAKEKGYHPIYMHDACIYFTTPSSLKDHINQSSRFKSSYNEITKYIGVNKKDYVVPKKVILQSCLFYFIRNPLLFIGYGFISVLSILKKNDNVKATWDVASSTKM